MVKGDGESVKRFLSVSRFLHHRDVRRRIVGFHQDEGGDWVAELSCMHRQHVRHAGGQLAVPVRGFVDL